MERKCRDIVACIEEDHESMRNVLSHLRDDSVEISRKKTMLCRFLPLFHSHTFAEEQTVMAESLQVDGLRSHALRGLEEHDLAELQFYRLSLAADDEQWLARLRVFCGILDLHLRNEQSETFHRLKSQLTCAQLEELGMRYLEARNNYCLGPVIELPKKPDLAAMQAS